MEPKKGENGPSPMRFAGLGIQLAIMILAGLYIGQWADRRLGTGALFTILGVFLGFGGTMWSVITELNGKTGRREDGSGKRGDGK
ncbi:MAG TPA: AtpZ/AtpI family protein [Gemmatimonadales bacterium]|nr:AtpZ/AtpI family protein [Gemmatimonadales bacterium]